MKKVLIVVDMQNDFVSGSLGSAEAREIVKGVLEKVKDAKEEETDIVFTRDSHSEDYLDTQEGKHLPVMHCVSGTKGWEIVDCLKPYANETKIIDKPSFGSMELAAYVADKRYTEIELVGLCTDICVVSNALLIKAAAPEAKVCIDALCCAGVTKDSHEAALKTMEMCQVEVCRE